MSQAGVVASDEAAAIRKICGLVAELDRRIDDNVRAASAGLDLTLTQANVLRELDRPLGMRQLADRLCCEPSNITFVVDRLVRQGLVVRRDSVDDRRAKDVLPTEAGERVRAQLLANLQQNSPLAHLSVEQRQHLQQVLAHAVPARPLS